MIAGTRPPWPGVEPARHAGHNGTAPSGFWGTIGYYFPAERITVAVAVTEQTEGRLIYGAAPAVLRILLAPSQ